MAWVRKCDECEHIQPARKPDSGTGMTDAYRDAKCRKCHSMGLDYGRDDNPDPDPDPDYRCD